ncbi:PIN domain-containing protein [bacterium]|nr:PIN domain-containing protein [Armatimonadota bacterium]NCQ34435.1 PIN domain-containing protein [bacterium]OIP07620.1 MAG: hypothetical protein AUJ96_06970 [Armatimonadetes bacterium CG2_30_66_41]NCO91161.1 PIN domain-containing protein [Armatimonadota bacterium]NCP31775.1 PIN domain-containing protein [Armatimonadota bacterium]
MEQDQTIEIPRVFFDAAVLIAGAASRSGAGRLLLKAAELGLVTGITSAQAVAEARRNLEAKLPGAVCAFEQLLSACVTVAGDPSVAAEAQLAGQADSKDLPILAAAVENGAHFLVTFNIRHYSLATERPRVTRPGDLLRAIRGRLSGLLR